MEAICYLTCNKNTQEMERRYHLLPNNDYYKSFILSDNKDKLTYNKVNHYTFNLKDILDLDNILRQTYLAIVSFYRQFPDFENYWLIEDDVVFKGNFVNFFDFYKNNTADLIAPDCGVNTDPNNDWYNSPYNRIEGNYKISVPTAGGLAFVLRLSNRLLKEISRLTEEKIYGHIESFPQTVCNEGGFELYSMKNDPFFDIQYCNWCHNFKEEHIINIPENKLIHAYKF